MQCLSRCSDTIRLKKFDLIVSNPPYYVDSLLSPDEGRNTARHAAGLPFGELAAAVVRLLSPGGRFALVLPPVEMQRFRSAALGRLYPVRWTEVCSTPRRGVRRIACGVLHDARTGSEPDV